MWDNLNDARIALQRDGWVPIADYWFAKMVSGAPITLELDFMTAPYDHLLVPVVHGSKHPNEV